MEENQRPRIYQKNKRNKTAVTGNGLICCSRLLGEHDTVLLKVKYPKI